MKYRMIDNADQLLALLEDGWETFALEVENGTVVLSAWAIKEKEYRRVTPRALRSLVKRRDIMRHFYQWPIAHYMVRL